jgi:hypothetical protein
VTVNGLNDMPAFSSAGKAHVVLQAVTSPGRTTPVPAPTTIFDGDLPVTSGTVTVPVAAMNPSYGYHILLSPAGRSAPRSSIGLDGTYRITASSAAHGAPSKDQALTIQGGSRWPGAPATIATPATAQDQRWALTATAFIDPAASVAITNLNSALDLDTPGGSPAPGSIADQENPDGAAGQDWRIAATGTGLFTIVNKGSGLLLGVSGEGVTAGTQALQWTENGTPDHLWTITPR